MEGPSKRPPSKSKLFEINPKAGEPVQLPRRQTDHFDAEAPTPPGPISLADSMDRTGVTADDDLTDPVVERMGIIPTSFVSMDDHLRDGFFLQDPVEPPPALPQPDDAEPAELTEVELATELITAYEPRTAPALGLHELVNHLKAIDLSVGFTEQAKQAELAAAKFTDTEQIRSDAELMGAIKELAKLATQQTVDESKLDLICERLRLSREEISALAKAAAQQLVERSELAALQAESAATTKGQIAKKLIGYAALGTVATIATGGLASIAALTTGRFVENIVRGSQRKKTAETNLAELKTKINTAGSTEQTGFTNQLVAMLAERKQRQLDQSQSVEASGAELISRLQAAFLSEEVALVAAKRAELDAAMNAEVEDLVQISVCTADLTSALDRLKHYTEAMGLVEMAKHTEVVLHIEAQQQAREASYLTKLDRLSRSVTELKARVGIEENTLAEQNVTTAVFAMAGAAALELPGIRNVLGAITGYRLAKAGGRYVESRLSTSTELLDEQSSAADIETRALVLAKLRERLAHDKRLSTVERSTLKAQLQHIEAQLIQSGQVTRESLDQASIQALQEDDSHRDEEINKKFTLRAIGATLGLIAPDVLYALKQHLPDVPEMPHLFTHHNAPTAEPVTVATPAPQSSPELAPPVAAVAPVETPAMPISSVTEIDAHAINGTGGHDSISAATQGDVPRDVWLKTIHTTKIQFPDGVKALWNPAGHTGLEVRPGAHLASEIIPDASGKGVLHWFDTDTHQEIPPDQVHKYLQEVHYSGSGASLVREHVEPTIPEPTPPTTEPQIGAETSDAYVTRGLREFVSTHPDYSALHTLSDEQLLDQPVLQQEAERLAGQYYQAAIEHGNQAAASTTDGGGEHSAHLAEAVAPTKTGQEVITAAETTGRLTPQQQDRFNLSNQLDQHAKPKDFEPYQSEVRQLLEADKNHRVVSDERLVFTQRGGQLFVDYAGSLRRQGVQLTEALFKALTERQHELSSTPGFNGKFDADQFNSVVEAVEGKR